MKGMRGFPPVLHPFVFALFPLLAIFIHNARIFAIPFRELVVPLGLSLVFAVILYLLFRVILRNDAKSGILVTVTLFWFFSFGHLAETLRQWNVPILNESLFFATLILLAIAFILVIRSRRDFSGATRFLNIASITLVLINLIQGGQILLRVRHVPMDAPAVSAKKDRPLPDIYYIVLDGYGRADVLSEIYKLDNSDFIDYLRQKGFYVASRSCSNYCQTYLSLASALNMSYLDGLVSLVGARSSDRAPLIQMIRDSQVRRLLEAQGYSMIAFQSGYFGTEIRDADRYVHMEKSITEFESVLFNTTPLPLFFDLIPGLSLYDSHRNRILNTFHALSSLKYDKAPHFVFAHIMAPHPPFVFGRKGEKIEPSSPFSIRDASHLHGNDTAAVQAYIKGYGDQLTFINRKVRETVDAILSSAPEPPVIILQGDHGPKALTSWDDPDATYKKEVLSILNAVYLPGRDRNDLYPEITPVNTFIVVMNRILGTGIKLLKDKSYFSIWEFPFELKAFEQDSYRETEQSVREVQQRRRRPFRRAGR